MRQAAQATGKLTSLITTLLFICLLLPATVPTSFAGEKPKAADLVVDRQLVDISSKKYISLFDELEDQYNFTAKELLSLFKGVRISRKVLVLMDRQWEAKPYYQYSPLFITPWVINKGKKHLKSNAALFAQIEEKYGVDREFIVAIWAIESKFGSNQGGFHLFQTLNTLFDAYPRRSDFFRKELIHFLIMCRENSIDPLSVKGSYAGAFGQAQFMPSSFHNYSVDFDGDNHRDLINSLPDILGSIANYLSTFGWVLHAPVYADIGNTLKSDQLTTAYKQGRKSRVDWRLVGVAQHLTIPRSPNNAPLSIVGLEVSPFSGGGMRFIAGYPNFNAITAYNHSNKYAMAVTEMAEAFKK